MKTVKKFMRAGALMSAFCVGLAACNESEILKPAEDGLGREIPGVETHHATGTIIGSYTNGFGSWLVQVDEEYPLGKSLVYRHYLVRLHTV